MHLLVNADTSGVRMNSKKQKTVLRTKTMMVKRHIFTSGFPASRGSLICVSWRENREPLPTRHALFEMPPSTTVDEQNQFISGLTGNNPITMPKKEFSLQDIVTSVTECILVAWIPKNMRDTKIHLEPAEALYFLVRNHKRESLC